MIKVGDRVRTLSYVPNYYGNGDVGIALEIDEFTALVRFDHDTRAYVALESLELVTSDQPPPASQDWTPHDRYTAAALTGLLARGGDTVPIGGFVAVARQIADEAMAAR